MVADLQESGYNAELLVHEDEDTPLSERVRHVNARCMLHGRSKAILVSIHVNAAGDGTKWLNASGWSALLLKVKPYQINLQSAYMKQQLRISPVIESEQNRQMEIPIGKKTSTCSVTLGVLQFSLKTFSRIA